MKNCFKSLLFSTLLIFVAIPTLPSCALVSGAAIGAAGTTLIHDRRNIEATIQDENISRQIINKLRMDPALMRQSHIVVSTYRKMVLLAGQTPNANLRTEAENIAKTIPGIARLYNQITIQGPTSPLTQMSDGWITTKVKTKFLADKNLISGQFKVVTENGTVFLMGIVSRTQAKLAVDIAKQIDGVQKVVKVFQYTRELDRTSTEMLTARAKTQKNVTSNRGSIIPIEQI